MEEIIMGSLIPSELTLDNTWAVKASGAFLPKVSSSNCSSPEKISKLDDYVSKLQDEMNKIDAFKWELPLCMLLPNNAIAKMKEEIVHCKRSDEKPIMEEFIQLKKCVPGKRMRKLGMLRKRKSSATKTK